MGQALRVKSLITIALAGLLAMFSAVPASSDATEPPAAPVFNQVQLKVLVDNDFAVFMGNDQQVTRLFYQNNVGWQEQVENIQTLDVFPNAGETFVYLIPLGGNNFGGSGEENFSGVLNQIPLLDYPGAQAAVGRSVDDERDLFGDGYVLLNNYLTNFSQDRGAVTSGTYSVLLEDLSEASRDLLWSPAVRDNNPSIPDPLLSCTVACQGDRFNPAIPDGAWDFPDGSAVLFRYPLSNANLPVSPGDREVTVTWKDPGAGGSVDSYLIEYKETDQPDSAFQVFGSVDGSQRSSTVTGLTNGTPYTLRVTAVNEAGSASSLGRSVVPIGTPTMPTNLSYSAGDEEISLSFSAPANDGGMAITNYEYSIDDGETWETRVPTSTSTQLTISNLTNFADYKVRLRAVNPFGAGRSSLPIDVQPGIVSTRELTYGSGTLAQVTNLPSGAILQEGDTFEVADGPSRPNFTFLEWKDGNDSYVPGDTYVVGDSNPNLTAQWIQNSLIGLTPENSSRVLTWNLVADQSIDVTVAAGLGNSVRIQIPANALDPGTEVVFWRLLSDQLAKERINSEKDYFVNLAVTWSIGDDVDSPKLVYDALEPISMTISNPSIVAGATAWQIIGEQIKVLGTASQNGVLTVGFTEDPVITAANAPPATEFSSPVATSDGFSVDITNYSSDYIWEAPTVSSGTVEIVSTVGSTRSLLVTGLNPEQSATITQRTSLNGVFQTSTVEGTARSSSTSGGSQPYLGPVIQSFGPGEFVRLMSVKRGQTVTVFGERLQSVTGVNIGGQKAEIISVQEGEVIVVIPRDAQDGIASLELDFLYGRVTYIDAFIVETEVQNQLEYGETYAWTRRISETEAKVYVKYPAIGEKLEILVQYGGEGEYETVFAKTISSPTDEALIANENGRYIVRTVELGAINRFRVILGGERLVQVRYNDRPGVLDF